MLLCTKGHFIKSLKDALSTQRETESTENLQETSENMLQRIKDYATDKTGLQPGPEVWIWSGTESAKVDQKIEEAGFFEKVVVGQAPKPGQRIVYVDGGFDLFSSGHIEFLRRVVEEEEKEGRSKGWYDSEARKNRVQENGADYGPFFVVAGIHDDTVINYWVGLNYPIMNIFERGLCVLQCRVSLQVILLKGIATNLKIPVHPHCHLLSTILSNSIIPQFHAMGYTRRCVSRADVLHSTLI